MPKKKDPMDTPVKTEPAKTAVAQAELYKTSSSSAPAKPVEKTREPVPVPAKTEESSAPVKTVKTTETASSVPPSPVDAGEKPVAETSASPKPPTQLPEATQSASVKAKGGKSVAVPAKTARSAATVKTATKSSASTAKEKAKTATRHVDTIVTVVVAKYDVGYGNNLYIRGNGAGLNWEKGVLMKNVENDVWVWTTNEATEPVEFKFLINDEIWSAGDNMFAPAGETTTLTPAF